MHSAFGSHCDLPYDGEHSYNGSHCKPSPINPAGQEQLYDPSVFWHSAFVLQTVNESKLVELVVSDVDVVVDVLMLAGSLLHHIRRS